MAIIIAAIVCVGAAVVLFPLKYLVLAPPVRRKKPALPGSGYRLIYSDTRSGEEDDHVEYSTLLVSEKYGIKGKPDLIYENSRGGIMPVELKSGKAAGNGPKHGDVLQLAAYFAIVEEEFGVRPAFGKLIYADVMFEIKNTAALRKELLSTVSHMRAMLNNPDAPTTPNYLKCRNCIMRGVVCMTEDA